DGRSPVLSELAAARETIEIEEYTFTDDQTVDALADASSRGVEVRVILERDPYLGAGDPEQDRSDLEETGAAVRWGRAQFPFTHAKFIVIDDETALITTLNLTRSAFEENREFGVLTTVQEEVLAADRIFEADWRGEELTDSAPLTLSP